MYPISAIPNALPAQPLTPQPDIAPAELPRIPGVESPSVDGLAPTSPAGDSFGALLGRFVEDVSARQSHAADAVRSLQSGGTVSLHEAVIAMEEANLSFQLMVEVRNKLLDAYQEIMRMQV